MYREAYEALLKWKKDPLSKPLIIRGARQVGKTWLMKEFGRKEYDQIAYFNFENTKELQGIFKHGLDTRQIIAALNILSGMEILPGKTLIIFDEIQVCPEAITSLKYFQEEGSGYSIFAAGSLLGVAMHQGVSFPVGKVEFLNLYPMGFEEFLHAMGAGELLQALGSKDGKLLEIFRDRYIELLRQYFFIGGMPEVVMEFATNRQYEKARSIQRNILEAYEQDFSKHAPITILPRIRMVWQSIVGQLAKENSKFIYNILRTGARAKDFELALEWLKDAGLIHKVYRISKPGFPIRAYADWSDFKVFVNDTGLLSAMGGISQGILLRQNDLFSEFKGRITEQYVLQQLVSRGFEAFYWSPEQGRAEIDFLIQKDDHVIPMEVKSSENLRSKSLQVYYDKYHPAHCIRTSLAGHRKQDWLENIPLYAIQQWLEEPLTERI